jgi:hypothetical protein
MLVVYGHARDFVAMLICHNHRIPFESSVVVISKFLGDDNRVSFGIFGISESPPRLIFEKFESVAITNMEEIARHPNLLVGAEIWPPMQDFDTRWIARVKLRGIGRRRLFIVPHPPNADMANTVLPAEYAEIRIEAAHKSRYQREVLIGVSQSDEIRTRLGHRLEGFGSDRHYSARRDMID